MISLVSCESNLLCFFIDCDLFCLKCWVFRSSSLNSLTILFILSIAVAALCPVVISTPFHTVFNSSAVALSFSPVLNVLSLEEKLKPLNHHFVRSRRTCSRSYHSLPFPSLLVSSAFHHVHHSNNRSFIQLVSSFLFSALPPQSKYLFPSFIFLYTSSTDIVSMIPSYST